MEYPDLEDVEVAPIPDRAGLADPSLLAASRIKAKKLREFVKETVDEEGAGEPASLAIILDYNGLRALVARALPGRMAILPPTLPVRPSDPGSGSLHEVITNRELLFFCDQIKDFLKREDGELRVDDGSSLFGPDGLQHQPPLLGAARIKAQNLLDFVKERIDVHLQFNTRVPVSLLEDYNQILAVIREAVPELQSALPGEIPIPAEPKPRPLDQPAPSLGSRFFSFLSGDGRPNSPKYHELLFRCQQLVRLLK